MKPILIRPSHVRAVADKLAGHTDVSMSREFICRAAAKLFGSEFRKQLQHLLIEFGIDTTRGSLFVSGYPDGGFSSYYRRNAMPVRFMFLEFIALYLEDECE